MTPVEPKIPGAREVVFAKDQPEYLPLPAALVDDDDGERVITRWQFTDDERAAIANGSDLYLELMTFGQPPQPIRLSVGDEPEGN